MELGHVSLRDGRRVDVSTAGDPNGPAVLLQHGMPQCRLVAAHAVDAATSSGVRLLSLSRPGFGHSTPASPSLAACGRDAVEVAAALGAERFAVLGISFGAPFAAATAAVAPDRVTALGIVGGIGPWRQLDADDPGLAEELEFMALDDQGGTDDALAAYRDYMANVFDDMLRAEKDEVLMDAFDALAGPDGDTPPEDLTDLPSGWRGLFARDIREALTTYDGIAHDNVATGRTWDFDPAAIEQPTFLWCGEHDDPSLKHAHWWQAQIPHAQLSIRPGRGHGGSYLLYWADMFNTLAAASTRDPST